VKEIVTGSFSQSLLFFPIAQVLGHIHRSNNR
jgi:hypothetical protein